MRKLAVLTVLFCSTLSALHFSCPGVCWDWCDSSFSGGVSVLYWKPADCGYTFARLGPTTPPTDETTVNRTFTVKSDYDWGFRVFAGYQQQCFFAKLSYLWLETTGTGIANRGADTNTLTAFLIPPPANGTITRVKGLLRYRHQHVDLKVGQFLRQGRGCDIYAFGRGRWAYIERKAKSLADGLNAAQNEETSRFLQTSKFNGGGLGVGLGARLCICNGLGAIGELTTLGLIGERRIPTSELDRFAPTAPRVRSEFGRQTCLVPGVAYRLGLDYQWCCLCTQLSLELGYEMDYYLDALQYEVSDQSQGTFLCHNVGFGGPYLTVKLSF